MSELIGKYERVSCDGLKEAYEGSSEVEMSCMVAEAPATLILNKEFGLWTLEVKVGDISNRVSFREGRQEVGGGREVVVVEEKDMLNIVVKKYGIEVINTILELVQDGEIVQTTYLPMAGSQGKIVERFCKK